jgi:HAD superfamily hydrolase (TIGR01490 family)
MRAAAWQLIFLIRGVDEGAVRRAAEDGMVLLRDVPVDALQEVVADAMEPILRPLIYAEPLALLQEHQARGESTYIVSASLQEIVQQIADDLGFNGAIGSTCEIIDGVYTGRALQPCYGEFKAEAVRQIATQKGIDLARSTAYSDSHTDLDFLQAVGRPIAVNPDAPLRAIALDRDWPILTFKPPTQTLSSVARKGIKRRLRRLGNPRRRKPRQRPGPI